MKLSYQRYVAAKMALTCTPAAMLLLLSSSTINGVTANQVIQVDHTQTFQTFYGMGGSWTDSAAWIMNGNRANPSTDPRELSSQEKDEVFASLFDKSCDGCIGLDILRQPMGTSDFRWSDYTYEDTRGQFTIAQDLGYVVPTIQRSLQENPNLQVMGIPWSPPAWAKTNNNLNNGQLKAYDVNTLNDYHDYFVDFVTAYEAQGVPIWAISVQNEPQHGSNDYPTMTMGSYDHGQLIKGVRNALDAANYGEIKVVGYDHNWDTPWYVTNFMNNMDVRDSTSAIGFHCYGGDVSAQTTIKNQYPEVEIFFTECTEHGQVGSFNQDFRWALRTLVISGARNWASTVIEWNLVLFEDGGPKINGGCSNCRGLIDILYGGGYRKNPAFYALGHVSKFLQVGAKRIASTEPTGNTKTLAMLNPDNSSFLVILNDGSPDLTYDVSSWMGADCNGVFVRSWSAVTLYRAAGSTTVAQVYRTTDQDSNTRLKYTEDVTCTPIPGAPTLPPVASPVAPPPSDAPTKAPTTDAPTQAPTTDAPTKEPTTNAPTKAPVDAPTKVPTGSPTDAPFMAPMASPVATCQCSEEMKQMVRQMAAECGMTVAENI